MWRWRGLSVVRHAHGGSQFSRISSSMSSSYNKNCVDGMTWWSVCSYPDDAPTKKGKAAPLQERRMIDRFRLWAKGGEGGNGCCSFRRTRTDRRGRPDGGNGGRGGDVLLECSHSVWDFSGLQHHVNAKRGGHGISKNQIGTRGSDKVVHIPVGTVIHLISGETPSFIEHKSTTSLNPWDIPINTTEKPKPRTIPESFSKNHTPTHPESLPSIKRENISSETAPESDPETEMEEEINYSVAELTVPGQRLLVAKGGEGGLGNTSQPKDQKFHDKSNQIGYNLGQPGSETVLILELKSIADVGLVGFPNVGKSTLLGSLSRAEPAVGDYAFTTLRPNIGNLGYGDFFSLKVADIPGLIKGAHENRGLGHAFLRHIERTRILVYVVDLSAEVKGKTGISPWEQLHDLVMELESYQEGLSERPSLVVANKIDEDGSEVVFEELRKRVSGVEIYPVCAVLGEGVDEVKIGIRRLMDGKECGNLDLSRIKVD